MPSIDRNPYGHMRTCARAHAQAQAHTPVRTWRSTCACGQTRRRHARMHGHQPPTTIHQPPTTHSNHNNHNSHHAGTHARAYTRAHACTPAHVCMCLPLFSHSLTHARTRTHMHACTRMRERACTRAHTHTLFLSLVRPCILFVLCVRAHG